MAAKLFAYGTLRTSHAPREIAAAVEQLRPIGAATMRGTLHSLGAYPGATFGRYDCEVIQGEVYEVPDHDVLRALDAYEDFRPEDLAGSLFVRRRKKVRLVESGMDAFCWVYEYNQPVDGSARAVEAGGRRGVEQATARASRGNSSLRSE